MKRIILVKNVIQQTNQYVFVSFWDSIDPQIVYKMLLLYILWLDEQRQAMKGNLAGIINNTVKPKKKDHICENLYDSIFFAVVKPTQDGIYDGIAECHRQFPWLKLVNFFKYFSEKFSFLTSLGTSVFPDSKCLTFLYLFISKNIHQNIK